MKSNSRNILKWPSIITGLVFALGLAITAWGFNILHDYSEEQLRTEIKRRFETKAEQFQEKIDSGLESLTSISALYRATEEVSRDAFQVFVRSDAAFHEGTIALGWVPRVTHENRQDFIRMARKGSSRSFKIFEVSGHGNPAYNHKREDYFPIYHLISLRDERLREGLNLASVPSRWRTMQAAVKNHGTSVTRRLHLYQGQGQFGFQAFQPVPLAGKKNYDGISSIAGFAIGLFDIAQLMNSVFENEIDLNITLLDSSAREAEQFLYHAGEKDNATIKNITDIENLKHPHWVRKIKVGDREWLAIFQSVERVEGFELKKSSSSLLPYLGIFSGILITSFISLYLFLAQLRGRQLFLSRQNVEDEKNLKVEAEQENRSKSRFLRAASHDLRQPLNTLSLYADLLKKKIPENSEGGLILSKIQTSVAAMNEMFNGLLDLGRLEAGQLKPRISQFSMSTLMDRLEQEFIDTAAEKNLQLHVVKNNTVVETDPILLERILRNLLSNAIRYTSSGKVLLGCRRREGDLRIHVIDTGKGFDTKNKSKIFEEFYQIKDIVEITQPDELDEQVNADQGLGIGLSIVAQTAGLLKHHFGVVSEPGIGTNIYIDIPMVLTENRIENNKETGEKKVLIIEDSYFKEERIESLLADWGIEATIIKTNETGYFLNEENHAQSYKMIKENNISVIIASDIWQKNISTIKKELPVIFISNDSDIESLAIDNTNVYFLKKPMQMARLRSLLNYCLNN